MINILITGARTALNNGTLSIIASGIEELSKRINNAQFIILSPNKDVDSPIYQKTIVSNKLGISGLNYSPFLPYSLKIFLLMLQSIPNYFKSDIIIDMRGEGYVNFKVAIVQSTQLLLAYILGKPFIIYAQSIGPFDSRINRLLAKITLNKAALITIREPISMGYFESLNIENNAVLCADQAILLRPASYDDVVAILKNIGVNQNKPIIGISPTPNDLILNNFAKLSDYLIKKYGAQILIIPHANDELLGGCKGNSDLTAAHELKSRINEHESVKIIGNEYFGKILKGIMGCCDIYISSRWHAAIASISLSNPTIVISSAHKSAAMNMVGMEKFVLDPQEIDYNILLKKVEECWHNRIDIRNHLLGKKDYLESMSLKSAELSAEIINKMAQ